jgi:hypothetical protein
MEELEIRADHSFIYLNEKRFFPNFGENGNALSIHIGKEIDLNFASVKASEAKEQGKMILWELDLELKEVFIQDTSAFFSRSLTLKEFQEKLLLPFKKETLGVSLFDGDLDFESCFLLTEQYEANYLERKEEYPLRDASFIRRLFAADVFAEYILRLHAFLPDDVLAFCKLDVSLEKNKAKLAYLLSQERFQHLLLIIKGSDLPIGHLCLEKEVETAVAIPSCLNEEALSSLEGVFKEMKKRGTPFRVIDELRLNECWDGIDDLIVLSQFLSKQGMRRVQGFLAAGGRIITVGPLLSVSCEVSFEESLCQVL